MKRLLSLVLIVMAITLFGCSKEDKTPEGELIAGIIDAYGGAANLKKLNSYTSIWNMKVAMTGVEAEARNFIEAPDNLRVEIDYPDKSEQRFVRGAKAFKGYNDDPAREVSGPQQDAMRLQLIRLYNPLVLKTLNKKGLITLGEDRGFKTLTYLVDGLTTIYYVHPSTNRIQITAGKLQMKGREMVFMAEYVDFKKVNGVLFHHTENKYAGGVNTATLYLKELKTNQSHSSKLFK